MAGEIRISIRKGEVSAQITGVKGSECEGERYLAPMMRVLERQGGNPTVERTAEFYEVNDQLETVNQTGGFCG